MRKKSHISLAKHIVNISGMKAFDKHKKAFYFGSILPDCKPSFLTKPHEINGTFHYVSQRIEQLTSGYSNVGELSTAYFTRLGEVVHYIADYFTFPHNKEYFGSVKQHCIYEGKLKHKLREYIKDISEGDFKKWRNNLAIEELSHFNSVADICNFLKEEHRRYIRRGSHSVEEDCKYIVGICSKIVMAILHVCMLSIENQRTYAVVRNGSAF